MGGDGQSVDNVFMRWRSLCLKHAEVYPKASNCIAGMRVSTGRYPTFLKPSGDNSLCGTGYRIRYITNRPTKGYRLNPDGSCPAAQNAGLYFRTDQQTSACLHS